MKVSWSRLPEEIGERVLSFLPVPALFRCRLVCKTWNEVVRKASFLQLCDLNGRNKTYLFVTHHFTLDMWCWLDISHRYQTCFLDLEDRRWYSIPNDDYLVAPRGNVPRLVAMDDGLVCEWSFTLLPNSPREHMLVMFDPVSKTRRELPTSTNDGQDVFQAEDNYPPVIVTVADANDTGFKVFLVNRYSILMNKQSGFFLYESSTNVWRGLGNPPLELGVRASGNEFLPKDGRLIEESAVFFRGNLYATFWYYNNNEILILSYNLEENLWREVYAVKARNPGHPQLMVSGNRLYLAVWVDAVWVESQFDISFAFPFDSDDDYHLVLFSRSSGKVMFYDVWGGSVDTLPAHPLRPLHQALLKGEEAINECEEEEISSHFYAKLMNLSVRNILSGGPVS